MLNWITYLPYNLRNICLLPCFALKCRGLSASSSSLPPSSSFWPLPPKNCVVTKFSAFRFFLQNQATTTPSKFFLQPFSLFERWWWCSWFVNSFLFVCAWIWIFPPFLLLHPQRQEIGQMVFRLLFWSKKNLTAIFVLSDSSPYCSNAFTLNVC